EVTGQAAVAIVEAHDVKAAAGDLAAELVLPEDHLRAQAHDQQQRRMLRVAERLVLDADAVGIEVRHLALLSVEESSPPGAGERLPRVLGLRKAIGNRVEHHRVEAEAAMSAAYLDVVGLYRALFEAGAPVRDAVGAAEDRRRRHGRRLVQVGQDLGIVIAYLAAGDQLVEAADV